MGEACSHLLVLNTISTYPVVLKWGVRTGTRGRQKGQLGLWHFSLQIHVAGSTGEFPLSLPSFMFYFPWADSSRAKFRGGRRGGMITPTFKFHQMTLLLLFFSPSVSPCSFSSSLPNHRITVQLVCWLSNSVVSCHVDSHPQVTLHFPVLPCSSLESSSRKAEQVLGHVVVDPVSECDWCCLNAHMLSFLSQLSLQLHWGLRMTLSSWECELNAMSLLLCSINHECASFILSVPLEAMCWNDRELRWKQLPSLSEGRLPRGSPDLRGLIMNKNFTHPVWYAQLSWKYPDQALVEKGWFWNFG